MDKGLCGRDKDLAQEGRAENELRGLDDRSDGSRHCWLACGVLRTVSVVGERKRKDLAEVERENS